MYLRRDTLRLKLLFFVTCIIWVHPTNLTVPASEPDKLQVTPFTISVSDVVLQDLDRRLGVARFPDEIPGTDWDYGTNLTYLKEIIEYWKNGFDWREQEQRLNEFEQFTTNINGLDIHFIHEQSPYDDAVPLLLLNGWPSSINEYSKVIAPLTKPKTSATQAFHVVIPSMPGYGFSEKPNQPGYDTKKMSEFWKILMSRLGYATYGIHASDWGASVANWLARLDTEHIVGLHLIGCEGVLRTAAPKGESKDKTSDGFGYVDIQSTKTQTLGYGLSDSPIGLAAWILEKYHGWSDHDNNLQEIYSKDELLTNIMMYWVTNSITSASRLYYENRHESSRPEEKLSVPTGCASFIERFDNRARTDETAKENAYLRYNIVRWTDMPRGGHFPALEQPKLWLDDLRSFFFNLR